MRKDIFKLQNRTPISEVPEHPSKRESIAHKAVWAVLAVTLAMLGTLIFWAVQPTNVLKVKNDPVPVRPPEVQADGGIILLTVDFCKNREVRGETKVYLVGETKGQKPEIAWPIDNSPKQCIKFDVPVSIPASTQTDTYHVVYEITYKINPIKSYTTIFRSRSFKVNNEKLQPGDAKPEPVLEP